MASKKPNPYPALAKARVPQWYADGIAQIAQERATSESEIFREAIREYLDNRKINLSAKGALKRRAVDLETAAIKAAAKKAGASPPSGASQRRVSPGESLS